MTVLHLTSWFQLFSNITSLYTQPADSNQMDCQTGVTETNQQTSPWTRTVEYEHVVSRHSQPCVSQYPEQLCNDHNTGCLFGAEDTEGNFRLDLSCHSFSSPDVYLQRGWASSQTADDKGREEVKFNGWRSRAGAVGRVVERINDEWTHRAPANSKPSDFTLYLDTTDDSPIKLDPSFSYSPGPQQPVTSQMFTSYSDLHPADSHHISYSLSPPAEVTLWARGQSSDNSFSSGALATASSSYGSKCWTGRERKRSEEAAGLGGTGK